MSKALLYALVAAAGNVLGALAVTRRASLQLKVIEHFLAFGAGFMLSVAIIELLPEAFSRVVASPRCWSSPAILPCTSRSIR